MQEIVQGSPRGREARTAGFFLRVSVPAPQTDPVRFLRAADETPRGFWERDGAWCAFAGCAAEVVLRDDRGDLFTRLRSRAEALLGSLETRTEGYGSPGEGEDFPPRLYGGIAFHGRSAADPRFRGAFPAARFGLPGLELRKHRGGEVRLEATAPVDGRGEAERTETRLLRRLEALRDALLSGSAGRPPGDGAPEPGTSAGGRVRPALRSSPVSREEWVGGVEAALDAIRSDRLRKVVLARPLDLRYAAPPDARELFARLRTENPGTFPFYFEVEPGAAFLAAAPELLVVRRGSGLLATAVAGTIRRGRTAEEDDRLARRLLESAKDRSEHEIGVVDLKERLAALAGVPDVDAAPRVLRLPGIQHLQTNLSAGVDPDRHHVLDLVRALHPTAAVGGYPRGAAVALLRRLERFERGWYAGPVGWFDARGDGEFAPALRSAVLRGERLRTFAGAGIVEGSEAAAEWRETTLKFGPILEAAGAGA